MLKMVGRWRILKLSFLILMAIVFTVTYLSYFRRQPPDVLLQINKFNGAGRVDFDAINFHEHNQKDNKKDGQNKVIFPEHGLKFGSHDRVKDGHDESNENVGIHFQQFDESFLKDGIVTDTGYWQRFITRNNFVAVGAVYNKCDVGRTQLGTVILEEDKEEGGIRTKTFFNVTLERTLFSGEFHLEIRYNGNQLYGNYWDLCDVESNYPPENRTFNCPVAPGKWSLQKVKHVPSYLPSGRYQAKAWAVDNSGNVIVCGFCDFQI
uniref:MD-2-related lipid-recognition domain-containing protein n=1 Tax=Arion vulgaris TaxID=1028688 RepID=A0A0B6ZCD8_9EUPU